ncbi:MAG: peptidoglycan DD-metalloendopeptidase family protein [Nitrosomonadales bacterium]|nr:peptidoglycan DD-metalloendopeptidase family protein [Nitrosomonadales bacterium]
MRFNKIFALLAVATALQGCGSSGHRAPVVDRAETPRKSAAEASQSKAPREKITHEKAVPEKIAQEKTAKETKEKDWRPPVHVVQKGDTLYSIAFNYGFDYHELAELNGIQNPGAISIGQEIRLFPGKTASAARPVESKQAESLVREQPKVVKYAYSDAAMAQIDKVQELGSALAVKPEAKPKIEPKADNKAEQADANDSEDEVLEWSMPVQGKLIAEFSESANRKGIDIAGKLGQPIIASAPGKVVYSGSGLRGYGKLIIIKHNKTYLSAYAHNDQVLVKEGQTITRGQKIAEMGNTDSDQVKLHFEVRRFGKPVDPAKYLPLGKS